MNSGEGAEQCSPCVREETCPGGGNCRNGHIGLLCGEGVDSWFQLEGLCYECARWTTSGSFVFVLWAGLLFGGLFFSVSASAAKDFAP